MEKQMSEIYTRKMFYMFQEEFWNSLLYTTELVNESGDCYMYKIKREEECGSRVREIMVEKNQNFASCSCKKLESEGIPCRHILSYLSKMKINSYLPDHCILKRWTQFVKLDIVIDEIGLEINDFSNKSFLLRRSALFELASKVIDPAAHSEEASKILEDNLHHALQALKLVATSEGLTEKNDVVQHLYNEPLTVRAKGCGKRLKGGKEKTIDKTNEKSRHCNGCGKVGQSHDKRNCPLLTNRNSKFDDKNPNVSNEE